MSKTPPIPEDQRGARDRRDVAPPATAHLVAEQAAHQGANDHAVLVPEALLRPALDDAVLADLACAGHGLLDRGGGQHVGEDRLLHGDGLGRDHVGVGRAEDVVSAYSRAGRKNNANGDESLGVHGNPRRGQRKRALARNMPR